MSTTDNNLFISTVWTDLKDISLQLQRSAGKQPRKRKPEQILLKLVTSAETYNWVHHLYEEMFPLQVPRKTLMQRET